MKTISIPVYNRPETLKALIDSFIATGTDLTDYRFVFSVDPSDRTNEVVNIANDPRIRSYIEMIDINPVKLGVVGNTYKAISMAMALEPEWNLYLDDDMVVAKDALSLLEWSFENVKLNFAAVCLCNIENEGNDLCRVKTHKGFMGWAFAMTPIQFTAYAKNVWFNPPMWDWSVGKYVEGIGVPFIFPAVSRARHGSSHGVHLTPAGSEALQKDMVLYNDSENWQDYYFQP